MIAAVVVGMVSVDFARSLRDRRRRNELTEGLVRWEGEGGEVVDARS
jgi:hypothetical protein